jgi:hypothetical protein
MSIDSCLKNLYFISGFVICTVKYTQSCALGTRFKHHFIHLSCHSSVHPPGHPSVPSWSVYFDRAKKEWNTDAVRQRIIYISVVNILFYFIYLFYFGVFELRYTHPISFSTTERVGLGFFFFFLKFYIEYWKFSMFFTLP